MIFGINHRNKDKMKKTIYFAGIAAIMLVSCTKEQDNEAGPRPDAAPKGETVTIYAGLGSQDEASQDTPVQNAAATKTTQSGGTFSWSAGEQISVGTSDGGYTTFDLADAETGTFSHTFVGDVPELQLAVSPVQSGSYTGLTNFTVSLPTVYNDYVSGTTNALLIGTPDSETDNKFLFHHAAALIKVTYNNVPYGTTGLVLTANENIASTSGITLGSTDDVIESDNAALNSSSVRINLASAVSEANQSLVFYVPVPVGEYTGLNIYLVNSSGKIDRSEKTATKAFTLARKTIFATPGIPVDITIDPVTVGKTDNSSAWGDDNGQVYTIPAGKRLNLIFENHSSGTNVWNNWVFYNNYGSTGHFVRADSYDRIDNGNERIGTFTTGGSYSTNMLNGATVTATIDYYASGSYVLNVSAVNGNTTGTLKYTCTMTANLASITTHLRSDGSHYIMKDAWLEDAPEEPVSDSDLNSLTFSNVPTSIYVNQYVRDCGLTITAHFADGTTKDVTSEATYSPEFYTQVQAYLTQVSVTYNKTKLGNSTGIRYCYPQFTSGVVAAPPVSIAVTTVPRVTTYYYTDDGPSSIAFRPGGMVVTSTDSAGGTATVSSSNLSYSTITKTEGAQDVTITYTSGSIVLTTTQSITLVKGTGVGLADYSTPFNTYFSSEKNVPSSSSVTFTFDVYSASPLSENYHCPVVVLDTDTDQYARADNYSWPETTSSKDNNWNNDWTAFKANMNNSRYVVTVTNNGNNTANIRMDVTWANGTTRYQTYTNIPVNSSNLKAKITCEKCYLVMMPE